jgi:hypothetical protein
MPAIFDKLFFIGPMSLGDSFVTTGIANYYGDRCIKLHYPAKPQYFKTLKTLFQDHPNITVIPIDGIDMENDYVLKNGLSRIMRTGFETHNIKNFEIVPMWDIQLYANYGLSFDLRYTNFRLPKNIKGSEELYQSLSGGEPYVLVHRYTGHHPQGLPMDIVRFREMNNLPPIKIIEIEEGITDNMMQYAKLIENAQEIHVVPSSFHCLVDSIDTKAKLFFHDLREKTSMFINSSWNTKHWVVVNYSQRL